MAKERAFNTDSGLNSEIIPDVNYVNGINPTPPKGCPSDLKSGGESQTHSSINASAADSTSVNSEISIEERAAIKAQSAFRGYLVRKFILFQVISFYSRSSKFAPIQTYIKQIY